MRDWKWWAEAVAFALMVALALLAAGFWAAIAMRISDGLPDAALVFAAALGVAWLITRRTVDRKFALKACLAVVLIAVMMAIWLEIAPIVESRREFWVQ